MKIATWNVNSLNVRLPRVLAWLAAVQPDVLCLQETKMEDAKFPRQEIAGRRLRRALRRTAHVQRRRAAGARAAPVPSRTPSPRSPRSRTSRSAWSRRPSAARASSTSTCPTARRWTPTSTATSSTGAAPRPRSSSASSRAIRRSPSWATSTSRPRIGTSTIPICGAGRCCARSRSARCSGPGSRLGLKDSFRLFDQPEKTFSWWDYRQLAFPKNRGLRIDHILLSPSLAARCTACRIDRNARKGERPSDHAPVIAELA